MPTIEIEALDEIDLDAQLPCNAVFVMFDYVRGIPLDQVYCTLPATVRLRVICEQCYTDQRLFYCDQHKEMALSGGLQCSGCLQPCVAMPS